MKHPETAQLAQSAFDRARLTDPDIRSLEAFARRIGAGERTMYRWLRGENPAHDIAAVVLREVADGWLPKDRSNVG